MRACGSSILRTTTVRSSYKLPIIVSDAREARKAAEAAVISADSAPRGLTALYGRCCGLMTGPVRER